MEDGKKEEELDNTVSNYLDDIFSSTAEQLKKEESSENKEIEVLSKNLVDDIFKSSLEDITTKSNAKKKKNKKKKFRLKTLTIDAKIDVIDEEDSEELPEDKTKKKNKAPIVEKVSKHRKTKTMDLVSENVIKKINNNKKLVRKLQLIKPPPPSESTDDFYLNKFVNKENEKKNNNDELCILF